MSLLSGFAFWVGVIFSLDKWVSTNWSDCETGKWVCWRRKGLQQLERRHRASGLSSWVPIYLYCNSICYRRGGLSSSGNLVHSHIYIYIFFPG